jgi:acetyl esterase/lipase
MNLLFKIIAAVLVTCSMLMSVPLYLRPRWPAAAMWLAKLYVSALSPWFLLAGLSGAIIGRAAGSILISVVGVLSALTFLVHILRLRASRPDFSSVFEPGLNGDGEGQTRENKFFVPGRPVLKLPAVPSPRIHQDISFAEIPGTDRRLLCDLWQPHETIVPSGMALIYLHGSAWYLLDKDCGTRTFFSHLASLGHVVMDVAYRLSPETDMMGMVNDVKRAIVWMKENAHAYGVDPNQVVVCGGSAGGHLALLAAYTANEQRFTPGGLEGKDLTTCAVISLYGPTDLRAMYYHTNQHLTTRSVPGIPKKAVPKSMPGWLITKMGNDFHRLGFDKGFENAGALASLMGGHPDEAPENYTLFSPVTHVHPGCPPTLLIHGEHDVMAPVESTRSLYRLLVNEKVQVIIHVLPQTDHAFDLILPTTSPSAHNAFYDVERFLALAARTKKSQDRKLAYEVEV